MAKPGKQNPEPRSFVKLCLNGHEWVKQQRNAFSARKRFWSRSIVTP